ncbi:hypothetical protein RJ45_16200 [Photobacterium gaetbulicola]|uniref:Uncharacterized protein n=1 Tax=Photobacterium gaetbulicola TaxID=1295392 RepID=A0A0B9GV87_9GAMM|nr:hypothetical protein RJ45_16200 [Photobacterium gaetbulicola]
MLNLFCSIQLKDMVRLYVAIIVKVKSYAITILTSKSNEILSRNSVSIGFINCDKLINIK